MPPKQEVLLGDLFFDLQGSKKKRLDWISLADKVAKAVEIYGSVAKAAENLPLTAPMIRSILRLKKLDPRVQEMVRKGLILQDSAQRLNTIKPFDRQYEVAKLLAGVSNKKQREIIQHAKNYPDSGLVDYRDKVLKEKVRKERIRVLIIPLREEMYQSLARASQEERKPVEKILPEIIGEWLERRRPK